MELNVIFGILLAGILSNNTALLNVEQVKEKLLSLEYIRNRLEEV